jgi:hypothetical protein
MSMIEKEYFTLGEVVEATGIPWTDVTYLAENGHVRLSVLVFHLAVDCGYCEQISEDDWDHFPYEEPSSLTGLADLSDRDAHLILKNGSTVVEHFKAKLNEYCSVAERARPQTFKKEDLLLRRSERLRLESLIKAKRPPRDDEPFSHNPDYREVQLNGHAISLGAIQAAVVKQLHVAYLAGDPWKNGKQLLSVAGSVSNRINDIFKSKKGDAQKLIQSNGRGLYRLAIPDPAPSPSKRPKK